MHPPPSLPQTVAYKKRKEVKLRSSGKASCHINLQREATRQRKKGRQTEREREREGEASFAPLSFNDQTPRVE